MSRSLIAPCPPCKSESPHDPAGVSALSPWQREICLLIAAGYFTKQIARKMNLAQRTIEKYRRTAAKQLGLDGTHMLVIWSAQHIDELAAATEGGARCSF